MANPNLRQALERGDFILAPGVYDMVSALIADRMECKALYVTGYGTVASALGLPDAGLATYTEMVEHIGRIAGMCKTPVIADADTGYGGLLNVRHTVRGYEKAGVTAIQLEDQEFPKKCGHTPNRRVISCEDMVRKVRVASDSRSSADFLIVARTDARTGLGIDEALRRGEAYAKAGADIIFIESPESEAELSMIASRIGKPVLVNNVDGGKTPILSQAKLQQLGFQIAIYPTLGFLAAAHAMREAYRDVLTHGEVTKKDALFPFAEFSKMMGFEDIWEFERRYAEI